MFIVGQIKCSWLIPHEQAICFSSLIWLSRNKSVKNLVSREWLRILENFHFSISISKHFDFTFHFSKKSESILISLCTSRKRVKAFFFTLHFSKKIESFLFSLFTSRTSKTHSRLSLLSSAVTKATDVSWTNFHLQQSHIIKFHQLLLAVRGAAQGVACAGDLKKIASSSPKCNANIRRKKKVKILQGKHGLGQNPTFFFFWKSHWTHQLLPSIKQHGVDWAFSIKLSTKGLGSECEARET